LIQLRDSPYFFSTRLATNWFRSADTHAAIVQVGQLRAEIARKMLALLLPA
jgi:hypothetical protein